MKYQPQAIEKKWQKYWQEKKVFATSDFKPDKFYTLIEFPYPSGDGLHVGHLRSITAMDVIGRQRRMQGFNVLYPIGMDAFGLPAENYAVKTNTAPQITTKKNITNFNRQLQMSGYAFDWSRFFSTTDEDYYRWTQWIFVQMYKNGLAYKAKENINWCPSCQIGLANEEVVGGHCERCGGPVVKKEKEQWLLKITKYADRLLEGLDRVDFLATIKKQQTDWIGRSEGAEIKFRVASRESRVKISEELRVFTTRLDTLFGATFLALAPEHPLISKLDKYIDNWPELKKYIQTSQSKTDIERGQDKSGIELKGLQAINPANQQAMPIFVADYVMMSYGAGAIMAVPAHDQRDFEFAKKYNLPIIEVIEPFFVQTSGEDAVRPKEKFSHRQAIVAVVKHWQEDKYLCLQWKKIDWRGFVIGGIEEGEEIIAAAQREIAEETGFKNARFIKKLGGIIHSQFYHTIKKENRWARFQGLYFELKNDEQAAVSDEEKAIQDVKWLKQEEVAQFLNIDDMRLIWERVWQEKVYDGAGIMVNSGQFDGQDSETAGEQIIKLVGGRKKVNYKLHDWIFSRQRYWGEPIPMVCCEQDGWQPVAEKDLPVILPDIKDFQPTADGQSPLAKLEKWIKTKCSKCGGPARRETDVMPNWAGSNWYFIRYADPKNNKALVDPKKAKYWLPVDWYNGGMEHTNLHLLYSRFVYKFLYDIGIIPQECGDEPYTKRTAQGMILGAGGIKMSKSKGNVIQPDDIVDKYGADTLRVYEMFMGPFDQVIAWDEKSVKGVYNFLATIWNIMVEEKDQLVELDEQATKKRTLERELHKTIKKVTEDIENMKFNTAISAMMIFVNNLRNLRLSNNKDMEPIYQKFILLLSPFAPHLSEELWHRIHNRNEDERKSMAYEKWPEYNKTLVQAESVQIAIQIDGKVRDTVELLFDAEPSDQVKEEVLKRAKVQKYLAGKSVQKFIHIKNKIISIVTD